MNEDLTTFIEPELEARIVALVLGEASAFEQEELERVIAQRPELRLFKERLEKLHGLVGTAVRPPDEDDWKLSDNRREKILQKINEPGPVAEKAPGHRVVKFPRKLVYYGSAACFIAIVGGLAAPAVLKNKKESQADVAVFYDARASEQSLSESLVARNYSVPAEEPSAPKGSESAMDVLANIDGVYYDDGQLDDLNVRLSRTRSTSGKKSKSKLVASNTVAPNAVPVPAMDVPVASADFGNGDAFGDGWGEGRESKSQSTRNTAKRGENLAASRMNIREGGIQNEITSLYASGNEMKDSDPGADRFIKAETALASSPPKPSKPSKPSKPVPGSLEPAPEPPSAPRFGLEEDFDVDKAEAGVTYEFALREREDRKKEPANKSSKPSAPSSSMAAIVPAGSAVDGGLTVDEASVRGRTQNQSGSSRFFAGGVAGGGAGQLNMDFVPSADGVTIPGIPNAPEQAASGIVTGGLRSGTSAVDRKSVDALLNSPGGSVATLGDARWGIPNESGGEEEAKDFGHEARMGNNEFSEEAEEARPAVIAGKAAVDEFKSAASSEVEELERFERSKQVQNMMGEPTDALELADENRNDAFGRGGRGSELAGKEEGGDDDPFAGGGGEGDDFGGADPFAASDKEANMKRDQEAVAQADELLMKGRKAYAEGDYESAASSYRASLDALPPGGRTEDRRKVMSDHLKDSSVALSQEYRRSGRYDEARELLSKAEKRNPEDRTIRREIAYLDDPIRTNPGLGLDPDQAKGKDQIRRNLYQGEGLYDLGQYDKAEEHFKKVLRTDPYNKAARRWLERTASIKSDYYRAAYDHTRAGMTLPDGEIDEEKLREGQVAQPQNGRNAGEAQELLSQVEAQLDEFVEMDQDGDSSALTDTEKIDQVRRGLYTGEGYYNLGLYDKAEVEFKKVLRTDPYNMEARQWFSKNAETKEEFAGSDYSTTRARMLAEVDAAWELAIPPVEVEGKDSVVNKRWVLPSGFKTHLSESLNKFGEEADSFSGEDFQVPAGASVLELLKLSGVSFPDGSEVTLDPESNTLEVRNTPQNLKMVDQLVRVAGEQELQKERKRIASLKKIESFETSVAKKSDSTFSLNVSDVSFKLAKSSLANGQWPDAAKVRPEEFVNALNYGDDSPTQSEKVACVIEQGGHPFMQQRNLMRVSMSTAALGRNASTPLRLTVLLDQSGSMERADRAESVRRAFALLSRQLNANDEITLVGFARTPRLLAERVKGNESGKLAEIVSNPLTEGGTNLEAALTSGLQLARQQFVEGAQNRIILLTDGAANLGDALPDNLARQVSQMRDAGIAFDACGVGADGLNDEILTSLTKQGDGRYYFLDRPEDADDGFARQIAGALRPAAKNVKVQVIFNPERVSKFKLYGFEKHKLKKEDFRNDAVDAAEMAAEESGVALYHFEPLPQGNGDIGTVSVRFLDAATNQMVERTWTIPYEPDSSSFTEANPTLRLAGVAGLFAEKLKGSPVGERVELKRLRQEAQLLKPVFQNQARFQELQTMLNQAGE